MRSLQADRGFALFVVVIVGLGVGACVTVFSVVDALVLRPLPFAAPERLVWISNGSWGQGQALSEISVQVAYVNELREGSATLADVGGYHLFDGDGDHALSVAGEPVRVTRLRVTPNLFDVLGVRPAHGRLFSDDESRDDGPPAVVLTDGFFRRRFGGDPSVVGSTVTLDGKATTVVGVLPRPSHSRRSSRPAAASTTWRRFRSRTGATAPATRLD